MKLIPLTKGKFAKVDDDIFEEINRRKWHFSCGYAVRTAVKAERLIGRKKSIMMHREITNTPEGMDVDHIDGDKLNNTRSNLRSCETAKNCANSNIKSSNKSGKKGVHFCRWSGKWRAGIKVNGNHKRLGRFDSIKDAADAYDAAALKYFGEFALTNKMIEQRGA